MNKFIEYSDLNKFVAFLNDSNVNDLSYSSVEKEIFGNEMSKCIIFEEKEEIVGYCHFYDLIDRIDIVNIYVNCKYRKKNIAFNLLNEVFKYAKNKKYLNVTLEVKENNVAALALYKKFNFKKVAIRKKYYGKIDGILMEKKLR